MSEREELKPCPFCGEKPRLYGSQQIAGNESVACDNEDCGANPATDYMPFNLAIAAWNRRAEA